MLSVTMISVVCYCYFERRFAECRYAVCHYSKYVWTFRVPDIFSNSKSLSCKTEKAKLIKKIFMWLPPGPMLKNVFGIIYIFVQKARVFVTHKHSSTLVYLHLSASIELVFLRELSLLINNTRQEVTNTLAYFWNKC
jgi:hypothetical protein